MSKEIYISSTPHETRLAIVENEQLSEIYYERENEYTLAGSIYNGKVTRVLPGMQSSFVDIGLERDAFLYVTDFMEEQGDAADFETDGGGSRSERRPVVEAVSGGEVRTEGRSEPREGGRDGRRGRRGDRGRNRQQGDRDQQRTPVEAVPVREELDEDARAFADAQAGGEFGNVVHESGQEAPQGEEIVQGSRRWRGRRGRRRGRGTGQAEAATSNADVASGTYAEHVEPALLANNAEIEEVAEDVSPISAAAPSGEIVYEQRPANGFESGRDAGSEPRREGGRKDGRGGRDRGRGGRRDDRRGGRDREGGRDGARREPFASSYGATPDENLPEAPTEPIILPGESLGKYRPGSEQATESVVAAAPVVDTFVAEGWDGGFVLPGETIRPRNNRGTERREPRTESRSEVRHTEPRSVVPFVQSVVEAPVEAAPAVAAEPEKLAVVSPVEEQPVVAETAPVAADVHEVAAVAEPVEYEPKEGASAAHLDDAQRRDYRRADVEFETEVAEEEAVAAENAAAETAVHDAGYAVTEIQPTGEMLSQEPQHPEPTSQDLHHQESVITHETVVQEAAVHSAPLSHAEGTPVPQVFAFGEGDLHEEVIDEEEFEFETLAALEDDVDFEEMEEETLEGAPDLGSILRDLSIDEQTAPERDENGVEDEFEDEGSYEIEEQPASLAGEDEGTTEKTGGGERPARRDHPRRGERRGGRRDSRGGPGGGRGRGRQSMQTTDLPAINELLKPGQEILVQIAKEPIAKKGARITSHIALPGRFLVFMPTVNHTGVSRKISSDEERRRLKSILLSEKGDATGGFIVRTAADGASEEELRSDLRFLINLWTDIKSRSESSKSPALIYHDLNLVERVLRDQVGDNFSAIWVDTETEYERVLRFLQRFQPSLIRRVKLYTKETPLFEQFGITTEIDKALKSKVWLKSGGSIVINQTEALVAIDINTGKYVGKTARLEDTILKTNLDAVPEIVRQIRLRDLGGIIVIDFIDMDERKNRQKVLQALEEELKFDRAPSKVLQFNDFGLVAITRKRVKQSLERTLSTQCMICTGTGMVKSPVTVANEIYVEMRKMYRHLDRNDVMLRVHPEVVKQLKLSGSKWLQEMEEMTGKTILVKSDPSLNPEQFDIH